MAEEAGITELELESDATTLVEEDESEDESEEDEDSVMENHRKAAIESGRRYGEAAVRLVDLYSKGLPGPALPYASINRNHRCFHNQPLFDAHRALYNMGKIIPRNPRLKTWLMEKPLLHWTPGFEPSAWDVRRAVEIISRAAVRYLDHTEDACTGHILLVNNFSIFFRAMHRKEEDADVDSDSPWRSPGPLSRDEWDELLCYCDYVDGAGYLGSCWCGKGEGGSDEQYYAAMIETEQIHDPCQWLINNAQDDTWRRMTSS